MNIGQIGAAAPQVLQAAASASEATEAPGVNDHDADDVGGAEPAAAPRSPPPPGLGTAVDQLA